MTEEKTDPRSRLKVIVGGRPYPTSHGSIQIMVTSAAVPPPEAKVIVYEEDTFLVLSAPIEWKEPGEHPVRVMDDAYSADPETPGHVIVREGRPVKFLAVVHDLSQEPTWKEEWVAAALAVIFCEGESRKLTSMALPLLGTRHGSLETKRFFSLLRHALDRASLRHLKYLWLMMPEEALNDLPFLFQHD